MGDNPDILPSMLPGHNVASTQTKINTEFNPFAMSGVDFAAALAPIPAPIPVLAVIAPEPTPTLA